MAHIVVSAWNEAEGDAWLAAQPWAQERRDEAERARHAARRVERHFYDGWDGLQKRLHHSAEKRTRRPRRHGWRERCYNPRYRTVNRIWRSYPFDKTVPF